MSGNPMPPLSPKEVDRLLADSPMPAPRRGGGACTPLRTPRGIPKVTITDDDLALLDETSIIEQSSPSVDLGSTEDAMQLALRPSNVPTDPTPEQVSEIAVVNEGPSEGINALTVFGRAPSSLCPRESPGGFEPPPRRGSLSHLAYGLSTLMGHPISGGSVSAELSAPTSQPSSLSVFSPLISQSSRVLSGVVSSLFSPWSNANTSLLASPRPIAEEEEDARSEESLAEDRPCEDSLINAFERIAVTDGNSEADVYFSPTRERETSSGRVTPSRLAVPQVELHSTFMEDAQCDFTHTETSSHYSDAVSALSSSQASRTPTGHSFVSQVRVQGVALEPPVLGEDGTPTVRCSVSTCIDVSGDLADVKKSPAANLLSKRKIGTMQQKVNLAARDSSEKRLKKPFTPKKNASLGAVGSRKGEQCNVSPSNLIHSSATDEDSGAFKEASTSKVVLGAAAEKRRSVVQLEPELGEPQPVDIEVDSNENKINLSDLQREISMALMELEPIINPNVTIAESLQSLNVSLKDSTDSGKPQFPGILVTETVPAKEIDVPRKRKKVSFPVGDFSLPIIDQKVDANADSSIKVTPLDGDISTNKGFIPQESEITSSFLEVEKVAIAALSEHQQQLNVTLEELVSHGEEYIVKTIVEGSPSSQELEAGPLNLFGGISAEDCKCTTSLSESLPQMNLITHDATELPETSNSLNRESASMGVHVPLSQSVQQSNMVTQVQGRAILQSANRPRIPMSPVPLMVSMHHDDDNWNRSLCSSSRASGSLRLSRRGSRTPISPALVADPPENDSEGERSSSRMSSGRFSGPLNPRRISKNSGTDGKSQSRLEIIPQAQEIVAMESEGSVKPSKRRETVTLEQPSPHLLQSLKHSTSSIVDIDTANTGVQSSEDSQPIDDKEQSTDDKENVSPEKNASTTVARRRGTHRLPMLSVQALEPVPPPRKSNQGSKENSGLNNDQSVIEEKARLRQEVATLRAKEDTLRMVLSKYAATLEEAGDAQGRLCFATGQACAQAAQEKAEARRSAASLQGAVGDSHRRHLRYRAEIERARASQEELLQTIEALKACYAKRAFKGQNYEKYCREKIQRAIEEQEATKSSLELEVSKVRVQAKQLEMRQSSLEAELKQKAQENQELLRICDSLLTGVQ